MNIEYEMEQMLKKEGSGADKSSMSNESTCTMDTDATKGNCKRRRLEAVLKIECDSKVVWC